MKQLNTIVINGIELEGLDPDIEIIREQNDQIKNLERDLSDINDILNDLNYQFEYAVPIINHVEDIIEIVDEDMNDTLDVMVDLPTYTSFNYQSLKIISGAGVGGLILGGVGLCFGIGPAVGGLGIGMGVGAGITSGVYYLKEKFINDYLI